MANDRMWLTYRPTGGRILLASSPDGVRWEPREKCRTFLGGAMADLPQALEVLFEHAVAPADADVDVDPKGFVIEYESDEGGAVLSGNGRAGQAGS